MILTLPAGSPRQRTALRPTLNDQHWGRIPEGNQPVDNHRAGRHGEPLFPGEEDGSMGILGYDCQMAVPCMDQGPAQEM